MGKTAFSGPAYGAKSLYWSVNREVGVVSTAAQLLAVKVLPAYEDVLFTELHVHRVSTGSTNVTVSIVDDSSRVVSTVSSRTIASVNITSSAADAVGSTTPARDGGEFEGVRVAGGSTLLFRLSEPPSSAAALTSSGVTAWAYGFIRYISSTRAEQ